MRCRVICKEYYTLYVCILFRYTAQFCSTLAAKFPIDIGGIRSVLEFFISSAAGRNFPGAHTKDYSKGPPQDICRADRKASVTECRGQQQVTQKPRRAGEQPARWVGGLAGGCPCRHPARGSGAGQPLAGPRSPLSSAAADLQSSKTPAARQTLIPCPSGRLSPSFF